MSKYLIVRADAYNTEDDVAWAVICVTQDLIDQIEAAQELMRSADGTLPIQNLSLTCHVVVYFAWFDNSDFEVEEGDSVLLNSEHLPEGREIDTICDALKVGSDDFWFYASEDDRPGEFEVTDINLYLLLEALNNEVCDWCGSGVNTLVDVDGEQVCQDCLDRSK